MNILEIRLLGAPTLRWQQSVISISRRQVRALLYRLAADMQPMSREHLCWLFWPDLAQNDAHRNLSHLLTHLRVALPLEEMLNYTDDTIFLEPNYVWSDSATFQRLTAGKKGETSLEEMEKAVPLYHGPFLDSFALDSSSEYESWVTLQRSVLEKHYLAALMLLTEKEVATQNYRAAISNLQKVLLVDPFDESVHRRLMEIYALTGNRVAAVREFDDYSNYLQQEMAMDPLPETQALIRDISSGHFGSSYSAIRAHP